MTPVELAEPFSNSPSTSKISEHLQPKGYYGFLPKGTWTPDVNLYETEKAYVVCVDISGVEKEKLEITVHESRLVIQGTRQVPCCKMTGDFQAARVRLHLMEIDHGTFSREVELPLQVRQMKVVAHYENGLLWIELPKK